MRSLQEVNDSVFVGRTRFWRLGLAHTHIHTRGLSSCMIYAQIVTFQAGSAEKAPDSAIWSGALNATQHTLHRCLILTTQEPLARSLSKARRQTIQQARHCCQSQRHLCDERVDVPQFERLHSFVVAQRRWRQRLVLDQQLASVCHGHGLERRLAGRLGSHSSADAASDGRREESVRSLGQRQSIVSVER